MELFKYMVSEAHLSNAVSLTTELFVFVQFLLLGEL